MTLDRSTARVLGGIGFVLGVAVVLVFLCLLILPSEADVRRAEEAIAREAHPKKRKRDSGYAFTDVTRWDFSTRLPVPGGGDRYRWRAAGEFACSLGPDRDRMVNFRLETSNVEDQIVLVSPMAVYDRKARRLVTDSGVHTTFPWGRVRSKSMQLELDHVNAYFDEDVIVDVIERDAFSIMASEEGGTGDDEPAGGNGNSGPGGANAAEAKKPLRITSDHFEIHSAEDKGVFRGNVVARDEGGTIWADEMIVEYYTKEEKAADPALSGMKRITCIGHVRIDQTTEQAKCERAVYDLPTNTITMEKSETAQVEYRNVAQGYQIKADKVTIDRNPGGVTKFAGHQETTDFSETREGFFGLGAKDDAGNETSESDDAGTTDAE
ncbi:MAG: hypothetical protein JW889_05880 [Verrucomicrobia bacterium]|nr:hypothetical protein [Verrucomicrobiota bacterium]